MRAILFAMVVSLMPAVPASAAGNPAFEQMIRNLSAAEGFSCRFRQVVYFAEGGEKSYTGELAVRRPGRFRWHYETPYEQLYVSDGGVIWHYEPDLMQAERLTALDAVDPAAMRLLDGRAGAGDVALLKVLPGESGEHRYRVRITGGPELTLAFHDGGELYWLESKDMLGNRNRMILLNVDHKLPAEAKFRFEPPRGVDVVDLTGGGDVIPLQNAGEERE